MQDNLAEEQQIDSGEVEQIATDGQQEQNQAEEPQEFEVELVGQGESPSPDSSLDSKRYHILKRLKQKQAKGEDELSRKQQEYIKQLESQINQPAQSQSDAYPTWDNFEGSESELATKQAEWQQRQVTKTVQQQLMQQQQGAQLAAQQQQQQSKLDNYAKAADSLRVSNFNQLQDNAIDVIGEPLANLIVSSFDSKDAALIMCGLGSDSSTALEAKKIFDRDKLQATIFLSKLSVSTNLKPKTKAPDPEVRVENNAVPSSVQMSYEKQIEKVYADLDADKINYNAAIHKIRELKAAQAN